MTTVTRSIIVCGRKITHRVAQIAHMRNSVQVYRQLGLALIPLKYGTKHPAVSWIRYQNEPVTDDEIQKWFFDTDQLYGVAGVLGPTSNNLVCLDIDGDQAQTLFARRLVELGFCNNLRCLLRDTYMSRSGSRKGYHFLFHIDQKLVDKYGPVCMKSDIMWIGQGPHEEIHYLGKGNLAILSPSMHPARWEYLWNGKPPLTLSTPKELRDLFGIMFDSLDKLTRRKDKGMISSNDDQQHQKQASLFSFSSSDNSNNNNNNVGSKTMTPELVQGLIEDIRPDYTLGKRQRITLGLAGALRWKGYSLESVRNFIELVCDTFDDEERSTRLAAVKTTFEKPLDKIGSWRWLKDI
jgi:hypothetical protein